MYHPNQDCVKREEEPASDDDDELQVCDLVPWVGLMYSLVG
jgi:hypothetical protein